MQTPYPEVYSRYYAGQDVAHAHRTHAAMHQQHAQAHQQQAQYHQYQAHLHSERASQFSSGLPYDERHTAYANIVSPAALVFHSEISPQAMQSLQQFYHPYSTQQTGQVPVVPLSWHTAHATENQVAMQRGHRF